jgi:hypothetical protein
LAACDLNPDGWEKLTEALGRLRVKLMEDVLYESKWKTPPHVVNSIIAAHWYAQSYGSEQYVDLYDFCVRLADTAPDFKPQCQAVAHAVKALVKSCYAGADFQESNGLSLYFPWFATKRELKRYRSISEADMERPTPFEEQTGWGQFLEFFLGHTRRSTRGEDVLDESLRIDIPPEGYDYADVHQIGAPANTRTGTIVNTKTGTIVNTKGQLIFPRVKNPALASYEDEC